MASHAANDLDWRRVSPPTAPPFRIFNKPIEKSEQDDREYRVIELENGLQATLIHDAKADKAAASLDVAVGHLSDPDDMPGLAHFCEHLLFMGTEQFPKENEYQDYLSKNNGGSNAYTSTSNTNYYFSIGTHALPGALERFSGFFYSPLFAPSCTLRELNAVDSEHKKNHQSDMWRIFQLNKHLSKDGHVWRKFGSGNKESLSAAAKALKEQGRLNGEPTTVLSKFKDSLTPSSSRIPSPVSSIASATSDLEADGGAVGRETRRRLIEWWSKEYCASRMRLCVIGKESLDDLSVLVSKLFSPIPSRGPNPPTVFKEHPMGKNEKGTIVSVKTIMNFHCLEIGFPLEDQSAHWKHKPAHFLSHFLGHEGPGSLMSYLKNKGWITGLSSGSQNLARGFAMFKITMYLTEDGFKNHKEAILAAFQYLSLLRSAKFDNYHQQEVARLSQIRFRFKEKSRPDRYATSIAESMIIPAPRDLLLSAPALTWEWDQEGTAVSQIAQYLDTFRITEGRVALMATGPDHEKVQPGGVWQKEPWYGTEYRVERFDPEFIEKAEAPNSIKELFLPEPNEFIPTRLDVEKRDVEPLKRPHLIRETPLSVLWHKKDDRFFVPKAHIMISFRSHVGNTSPRARVMTRLFADLVNDDLTELSYDADLAGLHYKFTHTDTELSLTVGGYNDKLEVLVKRLLEKVKGLEIRQDRLDIMKEEAKRDWHNFFLGQSYSLSTYFARWALSEKHWSIEEKLKELPDITPSQIQEHMKNFFVQSHLRILVAGNVFKDEAIRIAELAEEGLGASPLSPSELNERARLLPPGESLTTASNFAWSHRVVNPDQANSALAYFVQYGPITEEHARVTGDLLNQILSEPAFNILRTQEQLGYIVWCTGWYYPGRIEKGLRIIVQSEKNPGYLEDRVEAFLNQMKEKLEDMSDEEFQEHKDSLKKKWLEADKNLAEETSRYMTEVESGHLDFLRNENSTRHLETVTRKDVVDFFKTKVHPSSTTRSKFSVHSISQKPKPKRVSSAAAQTFIACIQQEGIDFDEFAWREALGNESNPLLTDFSNYWQQILEPTEKGHALLATLNEVVEQNPVEGEGKDAPRAGVDYIDDLHAFRTGLQPSVDPGPLVQWGDLPVSRF